MSKFFISIGVLVILVLFTALIGPYFVDWTSYRETFEREASAYVGRPVSVEGKASVRLLPTPVVSFTDVHIGDAAAPDVEMERFRAEVELTPLLQGEVRIIQMAFERPVFRIDLASLGGKQGLLDGGWRLDPERISLERLEIDEGTMLVSDSRAGRNWRADGIQAVVEADSLLGPGKLEANFAFEGKPVTMLVALGRLSPQNDIAAKITLRSPDYPVTLAADGNVVFGGDEPMQYKGTATVEGIPPVDPSSPRTPWADLRASGGFTLEPGSLSVDKMQITYGGLERPLILEAKGRLDLGDSPQFDVSLTARQIDVDRAVGGSEEPVPIETALATLLDAAPRIARPPLPGKFHLEAQGLVLGGGVIEGVAVDLTASESGWLIQNFSAELPGETELALNGSLDLVPDSAFRGHVRIASNRPAPFATWWRGNVGSAAKIGHFAVEADVDLARNDQHFDDLVVTTAEGMVRGAVGIKRVPNTDQLFMTVGLEADRADVVATRALAELLAGRTVAGGRVEQMTLSLRADVLSAGGVEAHSVVVEGGLERGQLNLRRLSVADLAGTKIDALGSIRDPLGKPSGNIEASINAENFSGAAAFVESFAPESALARHLQDVAPILSPMNAEVSASGGVAGEPLSLALTGSFSDTHLTLEAKGVGSLNDLASLTGTVVLHADGEDSAKVLRQLGLAALPVRSTPLRIDANFDGALAAQGKLKVAGTVAGVEVTYDAETSVRDGGVALAGDFSAESGDIDPVLLLGGIAIPGIGEGHAASAKGRLEFSPGALIVALDEASFADSPVKGSLRVGFSPVLKLSGALDVEEASLPFLASLVTGTAPSAEGGGWSDTAFSAVVPSGIALDLGLSAASLDLGVATPATDTHVDVELSNGALQLDLTRATFAGGVLTGTMSATIRDGEVSASLRGGVDGADLKDLVWVVGDKPVAAGTLDASFEAVGRGRSMAGVVATLSGNGAFAVDAGELTAFNPEALTKVMEAAEGQKEPDEEEARETFAKLFGSDSFEFGHVAGSFAFADGAMSVPTVLLGADDTMILAEGRLDLASMTIGSDWSVRIGAQSTEAQPKVPINFAGPVAEPERKIDLNPLINLLRSRFLQRQIDELDRLEAERRRAVEAAREAVAERRDAEPAAEIPAVEEPAEAEPPPGLDPDVVEAGPDLPPPVQLVPAPAPAPAPQPAPRAAPVPLLPPPPPPVPAQPSFESQYRMLPNGTVVKIR